MKNLIKLGSMLASLYASVTLAHTPDDPLLAKVLLDSLEWRSSGDESSTVWDAHAWVGKDLRKIWLKTEGEYHAGHTEEASAQLLYGKAIAPYWDVQIGWRHDFKPGPTQDWLAFGLHGVAPFFFETEAGLFVDGDGRVAFTFETERELMITQKWVLSPELELTAYGQNDWERGLGSGLSSVEAGIRLRYEIVREFAPYVGVNWEKTFGNTADFQEAVGLETGETQWLVGIRAWL